MTIQGTSIIFINRRHQVLLLLRDDDPTIPYPNRWDLPGGHVEAGETPEACIIREMKEEIDLDLDDFTLFAITAMTDRTEFTFWQSADLDIGRINLTEGQRLRWFTRDEARATPLAFGFNPIVEAFYQAFGEGRVSGWQTVFNDR